jgi:hypothetical protein
LTLKTIDMPEPPPDIDAKTLAAFRHVNENGDD